MIVPSFKGKGTGLTPIRAGGAKKQSRKHLFKECARWKRGIWREVSQVAVEDEGKDKGKGGYLQTRKAQKRLLIGGGAQGGMKGKAESREGENGQTQQYLHDESGSIPPKGWRRGLATVRGSLVSLFLPFFSFSYFSCPSCLVCPYCATPVGLPCVGGRISDMYGVKRSINKIKSKRISPPRTAFMQPDQKSDGE